MGGIPVHRPRSVTLRHHECEVDCEHTLQEGREEGEGEPGDGRSGTACRGSDPWPPPRIEPPIGERDGRPGSSRPRLVPVAQGAAKGSRE